jgi:hypothetical protein
MSNLGSRVGSARAVEPPHRDQSREMWRCCNSRGTAAFEPLMIHEIASLIKRQVRAANTSP